ncbi:hypothetical protein Bbelb_272640 [Branchiostoma belcheri]|nr:hypothetical protein Bbelb_272640 [Branchiostoma belcheri]
MRCSLVLVAGQELPEDALRGTCKTDFLRDPERNFEPWGEKVERRMDSCLQTCHLSVSCSILVDVMMKKGLRTHHEDTGAAQSNPQDVGLAETMTVSIVGCQKM